MTLFVIPSLSRQDTLCKKTLRMLIVGYHVPETDIHVFVIPEQEASYRHRVHREFPSVRIHTGVLGLHHLRNHIQRFFPDGTHMVCLDDDIEELQQMVINPSIQDPKSSKRYQLIPLAKEGFHSFIKDAFQTMEEKGIHLFGIYPVRNGYFMKDLAEKTFDLRFIVGCFWGCILQKNMPFLQIEEKEDVERTILFYQKDHGVLRYNRIAPKTSYYKETGGLQSRGIDRKEASKVSCSYLLHTYPEYCSLYVGKKSGIYEIKLKDKGSGRKNRKEGS